MKTIKVVIKFDIDESIEENQEAINDLYKSKDEMIESLMDDFENVSIEIIEEEFKK